MTHADVALMLGLGALCAILCAIAVCLLDWLQRQRMPRPPSDVSAILRKARL